MFYNPYVTSSGLKCMKYTQILLTCFCTYLNIDIKMLKNRA